MQNSESQLGKKNTKQCLKLIDSENNSVGIFISKVTLKLSSWHLRLRRRCLQFSSILSTKLKQNAICSRVCYQSSLCYLQNTCKKNHLEFSGNQAKMLIYLSLLVFQNSTHFFCLMITQKNLQPGTPNKSFPIFSEEVDFVRKF